MATFAVLVEFEIPDDGDFSFDTAAGPMLDALHTLAPVEPMNVTAFVGEAAEFVIRAGRGQLDDKAVD